MTNVIALADVRAGRQVKVGILLAALAEMQEAADAGVTADDLDAQAQCLSKVAGDR